MSANRMINDKNWHIHVELDFYTYCWSLMSGLVKCEHEQHLAAGVNVEPRQNSHTHM